RRRHTRFSRDWSSDVCSSDLMVAVWQYIIQPVFRFFGRVARWLWNNVLKNVFKWIGGGFRAVGTFFRWVWNSILKPVFNAYAKIDRWLWNNVLKHVFNWIKAGFQVL